jgi:acetylornithine/succinyldiaminopimelate/putrescine aminotransferase
MSTDPESRGGFGPYLDLVRPYYTERDGSQRMIRFGEITDLERALELHGTNVAAFLVEPIQGEAGCVFVNRSGFMFCLHGLMGLHGIGLWYHQTGTYPRCMNCARSTMSSSFAMRFKLSAFISL